MCEQVCQHMHLVCCMVDHAQDVGWKRVCVDAFFYLARPESANLLIPIGIFLSFLWQYQH